MPARSLLTAFFAALFPLAVACEVAPEDDGATTAAKRGTGELCAADDDCASHVCRSEGFCGKPGCKTPKDCPAGWSCDVSDGDPIFGFGRGGTSCQPTCSSCPKDTACDATRSCEPIAPMITLGGDTPHVDQLANIELVIDPRGRTFSGITWTLESLAGAPPTPSTGVGSKLAVTFHHAGTHRLVVTFTSPQAKPTVVEIPVVVCGAAGSACTGGDGACCGGACALERIDAGGTNRRKLCVDRCPASCAPGWSCREFDHIQNSSAPSGAFCLPNLAEITIDYTPKEPTIDQEITFTATATSPAGIQILSYVWRVDDSPLDAEHGPTFVAKLRKSGTHTIAMLVQDDAMQLAKKEVSVTSCIPANQPCGFTEGVTCCGGTSCIGSTCQ